MDLGYLGLDRVRRETRIELSLAPSVITAQLMEVPIRLAPGEQTNLTIHIQCQTGNEGIGFPTEREAADQLACPGNGNRQGRIDTSNQQFNDWIHRSLADLQNAGGDNFGGDVPVCRRALDSTVFGRDGLITGLEYLWVCPEVAKGVLSHLAATQATEVDKSPGC